MSKRKLSTCIENNKKKKETFDWNDINLSEKEIKEIKDNPTSVNWNRISLHKNIESLVLVEEYPEYLKYLDWILICEYQKLSEPFIEKHSDKVHWNLISRYQKLSEQFIEKHSDKLDWKLISKFQTLSEQFIEKHIEKLNREFIIIFQDLSETFNYYMINKKKIEFTKSDNNDDVNHTFVKLKTILSKINMKGEKYRTYEKMLQTLIEKRKIGYIKQKDKKEILYNYDDAMEYLFKRNGETIYYTSEEKFYCYLSNFVKTIYNIDDLIKEICKNNVLNIIIDDDINTPEFRKSLGYKSKLLKNFSEFDNYYKNYEKNIMKKHFGDKESIDEEDINSFIQVESRYIKKLATFVNECFSIRNSTSVKENIQTERKDLRKKIKNESKKSKYKQNKDLIIYIENRRKELNNITEKYLYDKKKFMDNFTYYPSILYF